MNVKKGDTVIVLSGKEKGKKAKILEAFPKKSLVLVEGVNVKKRHQKPRRDASKGQIINKTLPIHVSKVALIDPQSGEATRVGKKLVEGRYVRVAKKSGSVIA